MLGPVFFSSKILCDGYMKNDWYRFEIDGRPVEAANRCPPLFSCGTRDPVWIPMRKRPAIGKTILCIAQATFFFLFFFLQGNTIDI